MWHESAECRDFDPELWFPDNVEDAEMPIKICLFCEVKDRCFAAARANRERFGIWGGVYMPTHTWL